MQKVHVCIVRGLPGSGKTTLAEKLGHYPPCEADDYFYSAAGKYTFDPAMLEEAHEACFETFKRQISYIQHYHKAPGVVCVSNTFIKRSEYQPYIDYAVSAGCTVQVIDLHGAFGSVHNVPEATLRRMAEQWEPHKRGEYGSI